MKSLKFFGVILFLIPMFSWGALIELKGTGGTYDAANKWVNFAAGYIIDTDILDSNPDVKRGAFQGALKSGFFTLGSNRYELDLPSSSGGKSIGTQDYSETTLARGTLNFGVCDYTNMSGESLRHTTVFRSYPTVNFFNAGSSLLGLANIPVYFESDGEITMGGVGRYASLDIWTVATVASVPEPTSILLFLFGLVGVVGVRLFKVRR